MAKYSISQISFNAVSSTLLTKGIKRICSIMMQPNFMNYYKQPTNDLIDNLLLTSKGDIRNAVINLHFASQKSKYNFNLKKKEEMSLLIFIDSGTLSSETCEKSSKSTKGKNRKLKNLGCDESITLMHALGRVLNPKCSCFFFFYLFYNY